MIGHLRDLGVKIPITGTNWGVSAALVKASQVTDFADAHAYWWNGGGDQRKFINAPMVNTDVNIFPKLTFSRIFDKPFFVSEWDEPWPNEWRAESPLAMAAIGSFQEWSGFAIHTYRYDTSVSSSRLGRNVVYGGSYYRGIFDTYNDPSKFGLFYHAALLFRRGDVNPANESIGVRIDDLNIKAGVVDPAAVPALVLTSEKHRVGVVFNEQSVKADRIVSGSDAIVNGNEAEILSDTGELFRNWKKGIGWINAQKTKAAYGFLGEEGVIDLNGFSMNVKTDFATVVLSSLNDEPIERSENMLLTAVGRSDNSGCKYNDGHTEQIEAGYEPVLIEVIEAEIVIKTEISGLKIWSVNPDGFLKGAIPGTYKEGVLKFEIGNEYESMHYLIQKQ
jgi:hypothetical protein